MNTNSSIFSQCFTFSGPSIFVSSAYFFSFDSVKCDLRYSNASMNFARPTNFAHSLEEKGMQRRTMREILPHRSKKPLFSHLSSLC
jgi:hypothetical protein